MIRALTFRGGRGDPAERAARAGGLLDDRPQTTRLPSWYVRLLKGVRRAGQRVRVFVRLRRGVRVAGVWYKELSATPMHRALRPPPRGVGYKDYRVTFADGGKLVIRCTAEEIYADLMGSVGLDHLYTISDMIRPGWRVLEVGAGSGYRAAWLASVVGPSGSVVALGHAREPIEYAIRRYRLSNVAFEVASPQSLSGEVDSAFDSVVVSVVLDGSGEGEAMLGEVWRVLAPGGLLVAREREVAPGSAAERLHERLSAAHRVLGESGRIELPRTIARLDADASGSSGVEVLVVFKPEESAIGRPRPPSAPAFPPSPPPTNPRNPLLDDDDEDDDYDLDDEDEPGHGSHG